MPPLFSHTGQLGVDVPLAEVPSRKRTDSYTATNVLYVASRVIYATWKPVTGCSHRTVRSCKQEYLVSEPRRQTQGEFKICFVFVSECVGYYSCIRRAPPSIQ